VKRHRTQEVVIGGWTSGQGNRKGLFGALVVGLPTPGHARTLSYAGKVGTGFSTTDLQDVLAGLRPLVRSTSPFSISLARDVGHVTWVRPVVVGEVQFSEWTPDGRFRHPVWRGLRPDKSADEVVREP
jgi:bifunctional non-homologous end joining protein LigD